MTFLEVLEHLANTTEVILAHRTSELITDKHQYTRTKDGWCENVEPGKAVEAFDRTGKIFIWRKDVEVEPKKEERITASVCLNSKDEIE